MRTSVCLFVCLFVDTVQPITASYGHKTSHVLSTRLELHTAVYTIKVTQTCTFTRSYIAIITKSHIPVYTTRITHIQSHTHTHPYARSHTVASSHTLTLPQSPSFTYGPPHPAQSHSSFTSPLAPAYFHTSPWPHSEATPWGSCSETWHIRSLTLGSYLSHPLPPTQSLLF